MKFKLSIYLLYIIVPNFLYSQFFKLEEDKEDKISLSFSFLEKQFAYKQIDNVNFIDFRSNYSVLTSNLGAPCLPLFSQSILLPNQGKTETEIVYGNYKEYSNIEVLPCQHNKKRDTTTSTYKNEIYSRNEFYPLDQQLKKKPYNIRELRGQTITISPYKYNPVTKTLRVYYNIYITINIIKEKGENEIINPINSNLGRQAFSHHFINQSKKLKYNQKEELGEILILTSSENLSPATKLANWKNAKGIKSIIALTDTIGNESSTIKQFISSYLTSNQQFLYLILIGNHNTIPSYSYGLIDGEEYWSDSYYAQLIGNDLFPDVFTGRITGTNQEITNIINKIINYENHPIDGDWMEKAIGIGSIEGLNEGDDNEADWQHLRNIKQTLLSVNYSHVYEFYDGAQGESDADSDPTKEDIIPVINDGVGLINYTGHGSINSFHTSDITIDDIKNLSNERKTPFIVSVACNHGSYTKDICIAQQFMVGNPNKVNTGSIAFCGSSILMDWAPPMQTQDEISQIINNSNTTLNKTSIGGLFWNGQFSMLEKYGADGEGVMKTWILFGDPSAEFRFQKTKETSFNFSIEKRDSINILQINSPIENLKIGISYNNQFITTGNINNGNIEFNIPKKYNIDSIRITATKQNYASKSFIISDTLTSKVKEYTNQNLTLEYFPNPCDDILNIQGNNIIEICIVSCSGDIVYQSTYELLVNPIKLDTKNLPNGFYFLSIRTNDNNIFNNKIIVNH